MFSQGGFNWGKAILKPQKGNVCCICYRIHSDGERNVWHAALCLKAVFFIHSLCLANLPFHRKNYCDFNKCGGGPSQTPVWQPERMVGSWCSLVPHQYPLPSLLQLATAAACQAQGSSCEVMLLGFLQALFFGQGGIGKFMKGIFQPLCSFLLAAFSQPVPILHNIHSCGMSDLASGLSGVRNSSSQLKIVPSCNKTVFASFAVNDKQEVL